MSGDRAGTDKIRHDIANTMLDISEQFGPVVDAADGMRSDLERRGWSPTAAEQVALTWLVGAISTAWAGATK